MVPVKGTDLGGKILHASICVMAALGLALHAGGLALRAVQAVCSGLARRQRHESNMSAVSMQRWRLHCMLRRQPSLLSSVEACQLPVHIFYHGNLQCISDKIAFDEHSKGDKQPNTVAGKAKEWFQMSPGRLTKTYYLACSSMRLLITLAMLIQCGVI